MTDDYLSQGIAAVKAGNKQEGRRLLDAASKAAPNDERTWGWFYNVAINDEERLRCLKEVMRINPNNEKAKQKYNELIGLDFQTSAAISKTAQIANVNNAMSSKRGENKKGSISKIEWIIIGVVGGVAILIVAVIGILFIGEILKASSVPNPILLPTLITNLPHAQSSPQPSLTNIPLPTQTIAPSDTPFPTRTPAPTSTPLPTSKPSRGTVNNPYIYGESANFEFTAADGSKGNYSIQVVQVIRGQKANQLVVAANQFNSKAPDGMEYIFIELNVTLISGHVQFNDTDFYVTSEGQIFGGTFSIGPCCLDSQGYPELDVNLFQPTSKTGWIVQTVFIDDSNPLLVLKSSGYNSNPDKDFFFAIK